jgi:hypothetical protein
MLVNTKQGQPVILSGFTGQSSKLNGQRAYVETSQPDENGCHKIAIMDKPATKKRDAVVRRMTVNAGRITAISGEKPPRNFQWFFTAKDYRYAIRPSGQQPQQLDDGRA